MYSNIDVTTIIPAAEEFVMANDRSLYEPFFETAEKFIAQNDILIGGKTACDLAAGRPLNRDSFFWELYCDSTYSISRQLAVALANTRSPHVPARTTELQTNIKHVEFSIFINARPLFKIYELNKYRGVKLAEVMTPHILTGYYGNTIKCISNELLLVDIYRQLYSPSRLAEWTSALDTESKLFAANTTATTGGAENIVDKFVKNIPKDAVIIGDYALALMGRTPTGRKIQIISEISGEEILKRFPRTTVEKHKLNIPSDFQIKKYTVYTSDGRSQTPVIEVFNSSKFELIPWVKIGGYKVGNPWVLLRFIFIDIWTVRVIMKMTGKDLSSRIQKLYSNATSTRAVVMKNIESSFQLTNYTGKYISEQVAKKKLIKEIGVRYPPYYPAKMNAPADSDRVGGDDSSPKLTPVDLSSDLRTKQKILRKVTGINRRINDVTDILAVLDIHSRTRPDSRWGQGKTLQKFFLKNAVFLPFITMKSPVCLDFGCGDGTDLPSLATRYDITAVCADIVDTRTSQEGEFILIEPGQPLNTTTQFDIVLLFHCIHHMDECVQTRLRDIIRVTRSGGLIFIKDHNVTNPIEASNVDLEHIAYMVPGKSVPVVLRDFRKLEPMWYYPRDTIHAYMDGCELIHTEIISASTCIYASVFRKV